MATQKEYTQKHITPHTAKKASKDAPAVLYPWTTACFIVLCILGQQHASLSCVALEKCQIALSGPYIFPFPSLFISESRVKLASLFAKRLQLAGARPGVLLVQLL